MQIRELLSKLEFGNSVAEFDNALAKYFVETDAFNDLVNNKADIIAGDKGTGKTALFRILRERYREIDALRDVEVLAGFNVSGSPVFQRLLTSQHTLSESQLQTVWKAYIASLAGNWLLDIFGGSLPTSAESLEELLTVLDLRTQDDEPSTVFSRLVSVVDRLLTPDNAGVTFTITPDGMPVVAPSVSWTERRKADADRSPELIRHDELLGVLNGVLGELGITLWIALDRLDEAFVGAPEIEIHALRALFRTYLDLQEFESIRLKIFVRRDLFRRITTTPFVNLTHVNARKLELLWDEEDLFALLCKRIAENDEFVESLGLDKEDHRALFDVVFPNQVDQGERKPLTWNWMLSRIKDGNGVAPPRNLVDLATKSLESQKRSEARSPREFAEGVPLITPESLKRGLQALSVNRVEDTLLAEAGELSGIIRRFRKGKAEHNYDSLSELMQQTDDNLQNTIHALEFLGFLETTGTTYKVPMLYRDGLEILQGKAF